MNLVSVKLRNATFGDGFKGSLIGTLDQRSILEEK